MNATLVASLPKEVQSLKIVTMYETPRECRISLRFLHSAFAFYAHRCLTLRAAVRHSGSTQAVALDVANHVARRLATASVGEPSSAGESKVSWGAGERRVCSGVVLLDGELAGAFSFGRRASR